MYSVFSGLLEAEVDAVNGHFVILEMPPLRTRTLLRTHRDPGALDSLLVRRGRCFLLVVLVRFPGIRRFALGFHRLPRWWLCETVISVEAHDKGDDGQRSQQRRCELLEQHGF